MEKFKAKTVNDNGIELQDNNDIEKLYCCLQENENFVLEWEERDIIKSELIIATNLSGKVNTGDIKIIAKQAMEKK